MIGKFPCHVLEIGIGKTTKSEAQVVVNIEYFPKGYDKDGKVIADQKLTKTMFMSLKGGALPISLETLHRMGYKFEVSDMSDLADGKGVDFDKLLEVTIQEDTYEGKTTEKITGIWEPGQSAFNKLAKDEAMGVLVNSNISASVLQFMQDKNIKSPTPAGAGTTADKPKLPWA